MGQEVRVIAILEGGVRQETASLTNSAGVLVRMNRQIENDIVPSTVTIDIGNDRYWVSSGNDRGISSTNLGAATLNGRPLGRDVALQVVAATAALNDMRFETREADSATLAITGKPAGVLAVRQ